MTSQLALTAVNTATLLALLWYSFETRRLRIIAQDQLEALAKPCLTLWADLRNQTDAILSMDQAVGNTVIRTNDANFVVQNIGNGAALNIRYVFKALDADSRCPKDSPSYIQALLAGQKAALPEPINAFAGNYQLILRFEGFGGKAYESAVTLNGHVLVGFRFRPLRRPIL